MTTRLQQVTELLREADIEGLISSGAPDDEYDSEALMITDRVGAAEAASRDGRVSKVTILSILTAVWRDMFSLSDEDLALRREAFEEVATRIVL